MTVYFLIGTVISGLFLALYARSVIQHMRSGQPYRFEPVLAVILAVVIAVVWPLFIAFAIREIVKG